MKRKAAIINDLQLVKRKETIMETKAYDVIILGAGPAGIQAAIHGVRRKASVLVVGKSAKSIAYGAHIENFCCIDGASGTEMLARGRAQMEKAGAEFVAQDVTGIAFTDDVYTINRKQETNLPGVYAAGDICGPPWQVAKAVGEGCVAGIEAAAYALKYKTSDRSAAEG